MKKLSLLSALLALLIATCLILSSCGLIPSGEQSGDPTPETYSSPEEFGYYMFENGKYSINGYYGEATNIVIPSEYNGAPVVKIGEEAFWGKTFIKSLTIPDSIVEIDERAFTACSGLKTVTVGSGLTKIDEYAFKSCSSLESFTLSADTGITYIGDCAFENCTALKNIQFTSALEHIGLGAFSRCQSLTSIKIGNDVRMIGSSAFADCIALESIYIPTSVSVIGMNAFIGCDSLTISAGAAGAGYQWDMSWNPDGREVIWYAGYPY